MGGQTATVADALRLGCVGIGYTIYPGTAQRRFLYEQLRELAREAKSVGLLVVVAAGAGAAAAGAAAAGAAAAGAAGGAGPEITPEGVLFTYAGSAQSVHLAGDFNNWSTSSDALTKTADGTWSIVKKLEPGSYQYKFFIDDGTWEEDKANPNTADDGFGGKNSVVTVP